LNQGIDPNYFVNYRKLEEQLNGLGSDHQLSVNRWFKRSGHIFYKFLL